LNKSSKLCLHASSVKWKTWLGCLVESFQFGDPYSFNFTLVLIWSKPLAFILGNTPALNLLSFWNKVKHKSVVCQFWLLGQLLSVLWQFLIKRDKFVLITNYPSHLRTNWFLPFLIHLFTYAYIVWSFLPPDTHSQPLPPIPLHFQAEPVLPLSLMLLKRRHKHKTKTKCFC
jgi:hypothetical protein